MTLLSKLLRGSSLHPSEQEPMKVMERNLLAAGYGARDAARQAIAQGIAAEDLDEDVFASLLYTAGQPDPDLLIRTSGEMRVSNFLLWQIAYAEIWVTDTFWPDFRARHLLEAVADYQRRDRRYGAVSSDPVGALK